MPIAILGLAFAVILIDQATKAWALQALSEVVSRPVIPGVFHLSLIQNPGVAFGLFSRQPLPVALVTTGILLALIWSTLKKHHTEGLNLAALSLGLIVGGAMGNLIDRIRHGGVIDFLDFRIWPVFNVADSCITIGALLMAWDLLKKKKVPGTTC